MTEHSHDVVPSENVVDAPENYSPAPVNQAEATVEDVEEQPVSLDADPESDAEPQEAAEEQEGEVETEPEMIEFSFGGDKLSVEKGAITPELQERIQKFTDGIWSSQTKKSQENIDLAQSLKSRQEYLERMEALGGQTLDVFHRGKQIKSEIEQLSKVNWGELWQSNPDRARQISDALSAKQAELSNIVHFVDQQEQAAAAERQAELARLTDEGVQKLDRKYSNFSTQTVNEVTEYALSCGATQEEADGWALSPMATEWAYKAMLYDRMQAASKPKQTTPKAEPVKAAKLSGATRGNPNDMSFAELGKILGLNKSS